MDRAVSQFLFKGRELRFQQLRGDFLFIGDDPDLKEIVDFWTKNFELSVISSPSFISVQSLIFLRPPPKCIILESEHSSQERIEKFLSEVDARIPTIITILVTSDIETAKKFRELFPRLTVIIKGAGFKELLLNILPKKWRLKT